MTTAETNAVEVLSFDIEASRKGDCERILAGLLKKAERANLPLTWSWGKAYVK